jgi:hypothetical protein
MSALKAIIIIIDQAGSSMEVRLARARAGAFLQEATLVARSLSIGTLLTVITSLLVLMLVSIFTVSAVGACGREQMSARILSVVSVTRNTISSKENILIEGGVAQVALTAPESASPEVVARMIALHSKTESALASTASQLRTQRSSDALAGLADILRKNALYNALCSQVIAAVRLPGDQRPAGLKRPLGIGHQQSRGGDQLAVWRAVPRHGQRRHFHQQDDEDQ